MIIPCHWGSKLEIVLIMVKLALISFTILIINMPFGYWRANVKKYSLQWILAIHIPVLIGIIERIVSHLEFSWITLPVFILVFFIGHFLED